MKFLDVEPDRCITNLSQDDSIDYRQQQIQTATLSSSDEHDIYL